LKRVLSRRRVERKWKTDIVCGDCDGWRKKFRVNKMLGNFI
jgi:hypothetical protein